MNAYEMLVKFTGEEKFMRKDTMMSTQDETRQGGACGAKASLSLRHLPKCRMSSRAGHTVAHRGGQVVPSVQVLDGPTPGL